MMEPLVSGQSHFPLEILDIFNQFGNAGIGFADFRNTIGCTGIKQPEGDRRIIERGEENDPGV